MEDPPVGAETDTGVKGKILGRERESSPEKSGGEGESKIPPGKPGRGVGGFPTVGSVGCEAASLGCISMMLPQPEIRRAFTHITIVTRFENFIKFITTSFSKRPNSEMEWLGCGLMEYIMGAKAELLDISICRVSPLERRDLLK